MRALVATLSLCLLAASASAAEVREPTAKEVPLWQSLSDPWQHRLLGELQRPVSLTVTDSATLAVLRAISEQCHLAMSFAPGEAKLPTLTLDLHEVPLQAVLDRVATAAGLRYGIRSGAVRWEVDEVQARPPWTTVDAPMETRWYLVQRATGCSEDALVGLIDAIQRQPSWTNAAPSMIQERSSSILVTQPAGAHAEIERLIRRSAPTLATRSRTRRPTIHLLLDDPERPPPSAAERRLRADLRRVREFDLEAPTIAGFVARFTALTGIRVVAAANAGDLGRALPTRAIPAHHALLEPRHALELALAGTGLAASMRDAGGSAWMELAPERTPPQLVTHTYRSDWSEFDPSELVDIMRNVEPEAWTADGTGIEALTETLQMDDGTEQERMCARVTCSRETHAHVEERLAVMAAVLTDSDAAPAEPDLPAVVITVP